MLCVSGSGSASRILDAAGVCLILTTLCSRSPSSPDVEAKVMAWPSAAAAVWNLIEGATYTAAQAHGRVDAAGAAIDALCVLGLHAVGVSGISVWR